MGYPWRDARSPLWSFLRTGMVFAALLVLILCRTTHSADDIRQWVGMLIAYLVVQTGHEALKVRAADKENGGPTP